VVADSSDLPWFEPFSNGGAKVRVLDNFSTGNRGNLVDVWDEVEVVEVELRNDERLHAMRGMKLIFRPGSRVERSHSRGDFHVSFES
jgi:hypothetical protein